MSNKEWMLNLAMLTIGIVFVIESLLLGLGSIHRPGAGFLPFFTGLGLSFTAFFSLIKNFLDGRGRNGRDSERFFGPSVIKIIIIVVALVFYVLMLQWLGYLLSTFILLILVFKVGGFRKWAFIWIASFVTISISYFLFGFWLGIRLPKGFLGF